MFKVNIACDKAIQYHVPSQMMHYEEYKITFVLFTIPVKMHEVGVIIGKLS